MLKRPQAPKKFQWFYLAVLDNTAHCKAAIRAIGTLICKSKDRTIVEYTLKESSKPIGVATNRTAGSVPEELQNDLPEPEQIAMLLSN